MTPCIVFLRRSSIKKRGFLCLSLVARGLSEAGGGEYKLFCAVLWLSEMYDMNSWLAIMVGRSDLDKKMNQVDAR